MIVEHARLTVDPERAAEFEAAFEQARKVIGAADGFVDGQLLRGIESPGSYLFLVGWESVEAHMEGFRGSPAFGEWRALVGPFFVAPAEVEHFTPRPSDPT
jgi:heme-degrading monooxygenase HmoA